ncbi:MAG: hypothetical protein FWE94_07510 [Coriobacteriia bacterium]|nr:hypothetical protein [Coriobacteriia bacterium]
MFSAEDITPDYEFYIDGYHGRMDEPTFEQSVVDATYEVESRLWLGATLTDSQAQRCKLAVCAIADAVGNAAARLRSYTAGKVSETFEAPPFSLSAEAACKRYLANTGLLKKGRWL